VKGKNMHFNLRSFALFLLLAGIAAGSACAQPAIQPNVDITQVPAAAQPSPQFNADAATEAYMAMIPPAATARSNAYFEGGYWLVLWDFLVSSAIYLLLLQTRWSALPLFRTVHRCHLRVRLSA
jgi:STE24 endopeptidase